MGPIMGVGLALGINDFELLKKSLRNLALMFIVAIITSTVYFFISPLSSNSSELLARTVPTTYDVLICPVRRPGGYRGADAAGPHVDRPLLCIVCTVLFHQCVSI